jgi:hypothetical protein
MLQDVAGGYRISVHAISPKTHKSSVSEKDVKRIPFTCTTRPFTRRAAKWQKTVKKSRYYVIWHEDVAGG